MSIKNALVERFKLANVTAAVVVMAGLWFAYTSGNGELMGAIIGGGLTWLFKEKTE